MSRHTPSAGAGRAGLPLTIACVGFPFWWLLGVGEFIFILVAFPMALTLWRRGSLVVPRGFLLWVGFLCLVLTGPLMLTAQAPDSARGGLFGALLTFTFRLLWYLSVTVALLYVVNLRENELSSMRITRLLGYMFVVTVLGGLLGVLAPTFELTSPIEVLLPASLAENTLVLSSVHPAAADLQDVLGYEQARPRAPFPYANTWGASFSFFLPFFLYSWVWRGNGWRRLASVPILIAGSVGVVYSLNRGLWAILVLGVVYFMAQRLRHGGLSTFGFTVAAVMMTVTAVLVSPLSTIVQERLENQHSNARRSELAAKTVSSMVQGSPVIGFGNTRAVQGNFGSIAGGATPECPSCRVPPLGTQGQAWLVLFSQGVLGGLLFFGFFLRRLFAHVASRNTLTMFALPVVVFFLIETLIYDTLGSPLFAVMMALGLMWRADFAPRAGDAVSSSLIQDKVTT
jgi:hypothetical protein